MQKIADHTGMLANVRGLGFSTAAEIVNPDTKKSFARRMRTGFRFSRHVIDNADLVRHAGEKDDSPCDEKNDRHPDCRGEI